MEFERTKSEFIQQQIVVENEKKKADEVSRANWEREIKIQQEGITSE